jgi:hypothetical protein
MRECFQFKTMSMLDHGNDIREWYVDLKRVIMGEKSEKIWQLPSWIHSPAIRKCIDSIDDSLVELYQVYHDCGKPLCRTVDRCGKQHFPDHAAVSKQRWLECADMSSESLQIADLIGMDMDVHTLKADDVEEFSRRPQALTLLLTGLCELHSNSQMFGGTDSTGFKIKFKSINKFGFRIVSFLEG